MFLTVQMADNIEETPPCKSCKLSVDLEKPRWDQSTFGGRLKHFYAITDMRKLFVPDSQLDHAKNLVLAYRAGKCIGDTTEEQLWNAKHLYDSAFHPDSGEKMNLFGRMTFQVPGGMAITGLLLQFYKTPAQVALMQWFNQSFNAVVNYTNRNAASETSTKQMMFAYATATTTALGVALGLNIYSRKAPPVVARWVPFVAVASANAVNIPLSRQTELLNGVTITDAEGNVMGKSKKCAQKGISQVVFSRILMAAPGMVCLPIMMESLIKRKWFRSRTWLHLPFQVTGLGVFLIFMVPAACAVFPQQASMKVGDLELDVRKSIEEKHGNLINTVYFNKGL
nr:sideroflexin-2-like isoform X1 [Ciona intestinalis]|eukprot:XP_009862462.1 sideroflexin-2-like isoform X1 [Ciona intestinalis]